MSALQRIQEVACRSNLRESKTPGLDGLYSKSFTALLVLFPIGILHSSVYQAFIWLQITSHCTERYDLHLANNYTLLWENTRHETRHIVERNPRNILLQPFHLVPCSLCLRRTIGSASCWASKGPISQPRKPKIEISWWKYGRSITMREMYLLICSFIDLSLGFQDLLCSATWSICVSSIVGAKNDSIRKRTRKPRKQRRNPKTRPLSNHLTTRMWLEKLKRSENLTRTKLWLRHSIIWTDMFWRKIIQARRNTRLRCKILSDLHYFTTISLQGFVVGRVRRWLTSSLTIRNLLMYTAKHNIHVITQMATNVNTPLRVYEIPGPSS